jgi:hypothetical protein
MAAFGRPIFFAFWPFFEKNITITPLLERFQKMDPDLGAMDCGAELTRHSALDLGAEVLRYLGNVRERDVRRGQGLDALICSADLGALIHGADLGALFCGAEVPSTWAHPFLHSP